MTHWNLKMHLLSIHSTLEERAQSKYYCKDCDKVFFCSVYMNTHNNGIHHKNMILAKFYDEQQIGTIEDKTNVLI
jgi:hypothetical protein